jgi:DDE domain
MSCRRDGGGARIRNAEGASRSGLKGSVANLVDRPASLKLLATVSADQQAMIEFKGSHFERDVILRALHWYVAYPISDRQLEETMTSTASRLTTHALSLGAQVCPTVGARISDGHATSDSVPRSRTDETYVRVKGTWKYLYRAVDKAGARWISCSPPDVVANPHYGSCAR